MLCAELALADGRLAEAGVIRRTLDPTRKRATSLEGLGLRLLRAPGRPDDAVALSLGRGLIDVVFAMHNSFPDNLFWDLDRLWAAMCARASASPDGEGLARTLSRQIVSLQRLYGRHTRIQFRYVHDFLYGYDWAKWVRKDAERRKTVGPFDQAFLDVLETRGGELLELIAHNDATYPELPEGCARNPFGFTRDLEHEQTLHRDLSRDGRIPVEAWLPNGRCTWREDLSLARAERARALGLDR